ncbi:MAG: response regulator [Candidatus Riflebacteria bacterium]|nr:response regulator [Candidatus Riflebacteria bacterium]
MTVQDPAEKSPAVDTGRPQEVNPAAPGVPADARRALWLAHLRHDLRTPLNAVIGYSEMLLEDLGQAGSEEFVAGLRELRSLGRQMLVSVGELLSAPRDADGPTRASTVELLRLLQKALHGPANAVTTRVKRLMGDSEFKGLSEAVPDLRKVRFAVSQLFAMLEHLDDSALGEDVETASLSLPPPPEFRAAAQEVGRCLVVDDNAMHRDMLARRLQKDGHAVVTAASGAQALCLLDQERFDMVLLDMVMPETNGDEVLRRLKSDAGLRQTPVIMLSSLDEIGAVARCIEMGAEDYHPKPFDPVILRARISACLEKSRLRAREAEHLHQIEVERDRADSLLHVLLPRPIALELKATNRVAPRRCEDAAILFADIAGFTAWCESRQPEQILSALQVLTDEFEGLAERHGLLKIKTIGDAFMAAAGLLEPVEDPPLVCVECGLDMIATTRRVLDGVQVRVGIQCGPVVAGVVGHKTYLFDVWGDTVNTADRLQSTGVPGAVSVSRTVWDRVAHACHGESRGTVEMKGKGPMEVFRVNGLRKPRPGGAVADLGFLLGRVKP